MKTFNLPLILQLIGMILIITEIIIPSWRMLSIFAIGIFGYSLYIVFTDISITAGFIFATGDVIIIPILVIAGSKLLAESPRLHYNLFCSKKVVSQSSKLIYKEGKTLTELRPSGTAVIDGKRVDVISSGEYIEKRTKIYVSAVAGNQIIVREDRRKIGR